MYIRMTYIHRVSGLGAMWGKEGGRGSWREWYGRSACIVLYMDWNTYVIDNTILYVIQ